MSTTRGRAVFARERTALAGTGTLARLFLRRDRVRIPVWILGIVGYAVSVPHGVADIYAAEHARQARAELMRNPMAVALSGPTHGLDDYTFGALIANESLLIVLIAAALMSAFLVVRHTRGEEEAGLTELVRAAPVGRHAPAAAALLVVTGTNLLIGALIALGQGGTLAELSIRGAVAYGASVAAAGLCFAAVAAVTAQLTEHARGANGIAGIALGVAFMVRAVGDVGQNVLTWLSPLGWSQVTRPYVDERFWPLLLSLAFAVAVTVVAFIAADRRDFGTGFLRTRPGAPTASGLLTRPVGLVLRLQRGSLIGWGAGLFLFGIAFGPFAGEIDVFLEEAPELAAFLALEGVSLLDAFLGMIVLMLALLASGFAISAALRPRGEEAGGLAEALLATPLSRARWAGSHLVVAAGGAAGVLLLGCLGLGIGVALDQGDAAFVGRVLGAGLAHVPAVWTLVGIVVGLFGLVPRAVAAAWVPLAYAAVDGVLGDMLGFPEWTRSLSPFGHVPELPGGEVTAAPLLGLTVLAAGLAAVGLAAFRRRDLIT